MNFELIMTNLLSWMQNNSWSNRLHIYCYTYYGLPIQRIMGLFKCFAGLR